MVKRVCQVITAGTANTCKCTLHYLSTAGISIPHYKILLGRGIVKVSPLHAMKAYRENGGTAPLILNHAEQRCKPVPTTEAWAPEAVWALCKRNQSPVPKGNRTTFAQTSTHSLVPIPTTLCSSQRNTTPYFMLSSVEPAVVWNKSMTVFVQHISLTHCYTKFGRKVLPVIFFSHAL
jgi:hypothetical protein